MIGLIFIKFFAIFLGLCIYAMYEHCDPISAGDINRSDQVRSSLVLQTLRLELKKKKTFENFFLDCSIVCDSGWAKIARY